MNTLAQRQSDFMQGLLDTHSAPGSRPSARWAAGMDIYRNNYRAALVEALRAVFERTERLVGGASFARAAAHHLIAHPPSGWTLDLAGAGFAETCEALFAKDRDVAEIAWLEWAMHLAFVARDAQPISAEGFVAAVSAFGEEEWTRLRLRFLPGVAVRRVTHDVRLLWSSLDAEGKHANVVPLAEPATTIVWRDGERPVFLSVPRPEGDALAQMLAGATYGEVCDKLAADHGEAGIELAGTMLRRWLAEGLIEQIA